MNPADLIDFRPNEGPLGLWDTRIVLSVHHESSVEIPADWRIIIEHLVRELLSAEFPRRHDSGTVYEFS